MVDRGGRPLRRTQWLTTGIDIIVKWWGILVPVMGGTVSGYLAYLTAALDAYAPLSWFAAALLGTLVIAAIIFIAAKSADVVTRWNFWRKMTASPPSFNPLDDVFTRRQIKLSDLRNPFDAVVPNKTFLDCQLIGPSALLFAGNSNLNGVAMINCDCVAVRDNVQVHNLIVLQDAVMRGGRIYGATLLFPQNMVDQLNRDIPGIQWITR